MPVTCFQSPWGDRWENGIRSYSTVVWNVAVSSECSGYGISYKAKKMPFYLKHTPTQTHPFLCLLLGLLISKIWASAVMQQTSQWNASAHRPLADDSTPVCSEQHCLWRMPLLKQNKRALTSWLLNKSLGFRQRYQYQHRTALLAASKTQSVDRRLLPSHSLTLVWVVIIFKIPHCGWE